MDSLGAYSLKMMLDVIPSVGILGGKTWHIQTE